MNVVVVTRWEDATTLPTEQEITRRFREEGLTPSRWGNGPGDRYGEHAHPYHKVLYCVRGSITFRADGEEIFLSEGDRLEISAQTLHSAVVGPEGVICMEASRGGSLRG